MKDDLPTPAPEGTSPNEFESGKTGTAERSRAEAAIEDLRRRGGVFVEAVRATRMPMVLTDPNLAGNPIVFANESFLKLSGYSMEEVLGQEPHFMNGPDTDPRDAAGFAETLRGDHDDIIETVQYRKNGSRFVAAVLLSAFKDDQGQVLNHFMSWLDITRRVDAEDQIADLRASQIKLRQQQKWLTGQNDAFRAAVNGASLEESLGILATTAKDQIADANNCAFYVANENGTQLRHVAGLPPGCTKEVEVLKNAWEYLDCGSGARTAAPIITPDVRREPRWKPWLWLAEKYNFRACWSLPIEISGARLIGALALFFEQPRSPTRSDLDIAALLVGTASIIISRQHENEERSRSESALRDSESSLRTLLAELQHRVRNTLALVKSIATRTAESSESVDEMAAHLTGRLDAFARVQAAVTRNPDAGVDLLSILSDELLVHAVREGEQFTAKGPPLALQPKAAESISLALHELATNAVKHGALNHQNGGRIAVRWNVGDADGCRHIDFQWVEEGAHGDIPGPARDGFGMELLKRILPYDLGAKTKVSFRPDGMRFTMQLPMAHVVAVSPGV